MRIFLVVVHPLNEEARTGRKVQQVNNILYEDDSFCVNHPEASVKSKGTGVKTVCSTADIRLKVNSSISNPNMVSDKGSVAIDPVGPASPTNADILAKLTHIEASIGQVNIKLKTLDILETKVNSFEKDLKRLWLHVEDKTKETTDKLNKVDDRVDGLELAEGLHRDRLTQLEKENSKSPFLIFNHNP